MKCSRRKAPIGTTPLSECRRRSRKDVPSPARSGATPDLILGAAGLAVDATMTAPYIVRKCKLAIIVLCGSGSQGGGEYSDPHSKIRMSKCESNRCSSHPAIREKRHLQFKEQANAESHACLWRRSHGQVSYLRCDLVFIEGLLVPLEESAKSHASMTVAGFLFRAEFGERLVDCREIKQRIVSESILAKGRIENDAFGGAAESAQRLAVASRGEHADETGSAFCFGDTF